MTQPPPPDEYWQAEIERARSEQRLNKWVSRLSMLELVLLGVPLGLAALCCVGATAWFIWGIVG